jgi:hypothetical protein
MGGNDCALGEQIGNGGGKLGSMHGGELQSDETAAILMDGRTGVNVLS